MKKIINIAIVAMLAIMATMTANAQIQLTYAQAVQLVKSQRAAQNLDCDSVNFSVATGSPVAQGCVNVGEKKLIIPSDGWPAGIYLAAVIKGGKVVKSSQFIK